MARPLQRNQAARRAGKPAASALPRAFARCGNSSLELSTGRGSLRDWLSPGSQGTCGRGQRRAAGYDPRLVPEAGGRKFDGSKARRKVGRPPVTATSSSSLSAWPKRIPAGVMTGLRVHWPISATRSPTRRLAMFCGATAYLRPRRGSTRPRGQRSFVRTWRVLAGTDFFSVEVFTLRGLVTYYVLFFIHLETRRVNIAGITVHPDERWMQQIARNVTMEEWGVLQNCRCLLHDRDTKYTRCFRAIIDSFWGQARCATTPRGHKRNTGSGDDRCAIRVFQTNSRIRSHEETGLPAMKVKTLRLPVELSEEITRRARMKGVPDADYYRLLIERGLLLESVELAMEKPTPAGLLGPVRSGAGDPQHPPVARRCARAQHDSEGAGAGQGRARRG